MTARKYPLNLRKQNFSEPTLSRKKNFEKDFDYTDNELDYVSTLILDKLNYDSIGKQETEMAINYIKRRSIYEYD